MFDDQRQWFQDELWKARGDCAKWRDRSLFMSVFLVTSLFANLLLVLKIVVGK